MPKALVVVAHPDDEAIFFYRTIRDLSERGYDVAVVCATDEFGSPELTDRRRAELERSCDALEVPFITLGQTDVRHQPLSVSALEKELQVVADAEQPDLVYTHGPWGDYGHLHHVAVCIATHAVFGDMTSSLAATRRADSALVLTDEQYEEKREHLASIYESQHFAARYSTTTEATRRLGNRVVRFLTGFVREYATPESFNHASETDVRLNAIDLHRSMSVQFPEPPATLDNIPRSVWVPQIDVYWRRLQFHLKTPRLSFIARVPLTWPRR